MDNLGFKAVGSTVRVPFTTHAAAGGNVAPSSAFEAADVRIYKDGSATQRSSAAGITMTSPFDTLTGAHRIDIDLADDTDAGFYADGSVYEVWLCPDETIDGQTITARVLACFTIGIQSVHLVTTAIGAITRNAFGSDTGLQSIRSNTAQAGGATTITLDASASASDDFYNDTSILTTGGTGVGQFRVISDYVGATKVATVTPAWVTNPSSDTTFAIFPAAATVADIAAEVLTAATAAPIAANVEQINTVPLVGDGSATPFSV